MSYALINEKCTNMKNILLYILKCQLVLLWNQLLCNTANHIQIYNILYYIIFYYIISYYILNGHSLALTMTIKHKYSLIIVLHYYTELWNVSIEKKRSYYTSTL